MALTFAPASKEISLAKANLELAEKLYSMDPDWYWSAQKVQVFVPFEKLSRVRVEELIIAAEALSTFVNSFERDLPLSALNVLIREISTDGISIDSDS